MESEKKQSQPSEKKKRYKRVIKYLVLLVLAGVLGVALIQVYVCYTMSKYILTSEEASRLTDVDCILVLGAGVYGDTPSPMLRDRLETGVLLYQNGTSGKMIMSGDHGRVDYNEVAVMKNYAMGQEVPSEDIFMDHAGFSTYESAYRAANVFQAKKIVIVTQSYHMYRALYDARSMGLEAYGVCTDYDYGGYGQFMRDVREVAARVKDVFYCAFHAAPTYKGEPIPVSGNGDCTNDLDGIKEH